MGSRRKIGRNDPCPCGSGKKYKKCHLISEQNHQDSLIPEKTLVVTPNLPPISFEELSSLIAGMPCDPHIVAASVIQEARQNVEPDGMHKSKNYHVWHCGATILAAFNRANIPSFIGSEVMRLENRAIQELLFRATGVIDNFDGPNKREQALLKVLRLGSQYSLQGDFMHQIARTFYLLELEDVIQRTSQATCHYDILFQHEYDCTTREFAAIMLALWSHSLKNDGFNPDVLFSESADGTRLSTILKKILMRKACPTQEIHSRIRNELNSYRDEGLVQAFFSNTPILKFNEETFLYAPHPYMRLAAFGLVLFHTLELAREHVKRNGQTSYWTNQFSERMGNRFEELMAFCLQKISKQENIFRQHKYLGKKDSPEGLDSPDFCMFDGNGENLLLVQAKLKSLSPGAFFGYDLEAFKKDVKSALGESIWKSIRYLYLLENGVRGHRLNPEYEQISKRVLAAKRIFLLGVVQAMPSIFHASYFRELVDREIEEKLKPAERNWYEANKKKFVGWHILDSEELMAFVSASAGRSLFSELTAYLSSPGFGYLFQSAGTSLSIEPSFRSWFMRKHGLEGDWQPIREMRAIYDRVIEYSISILLTGQDVNV